MVDLPHDETTGHSGFERELPDNSVEYLIFVIDTKLDARRTFSTLEAIRKEALKLCNELTKDYIWQRDEFNLELKNEGSLVYLHGVTEYGDAVEDEWLIVYMLRQLTQSHSNIWARIFDTDGEFLLVEAANVLPKWLNPEIDYNRVWIHEGKLLIIPIKEGADPPRRNITLPDAVEYIRTKSAELVHSAFIESEAFYRLEKYPGQVANSVHYSLVTIPRKLACILHSLPKSIAPAVESFYLRDAIALKPITSSTSPLVFPPEDLVTISVRFSKVLFAQLRSQRFETPPRWQSLFPKARAEPSGLNEGEESTRRLEAGMKLTCGFEMLAKTAENNKSRVAREVAIMIEDLEEDGPEALPSDAEIKSWPNSDRNDSEAWLDINYEDFERELEGKRGSGTKGGQESFGNSQTQENLRKIVSRFEAFLNDDQAGLEGAELDDMDFDDDEDDDDELDSDEDSDAEDKEVSFDEEEFAKMMREMMGLPSSQAGQKSNEVKGKGKASTQETIPRAEDEEDQRIRELSSQMEAELNEHGALKLDAPSSKQPKLKGKEIEAQDSENEDSDNEVDVDYNLAKNILESFKSQGGMSGPTGNLLGMMGLNLPRDEDDGQDNDENDGGGPSRKKA